MLLVKLTNLLLDCALPSIAATLSVWEKIQPSIDLEAKTCQKLTPLQIYEHLISDLKITSWIQDIIMTIQEVFSKKTTVHAYTLTQLQHFQLTHPTTTYDLPKKVWEYLQGKHNKPKRFILVLYPFAEQTNSLKHPI